MEQDRIAVVGGGPAGSMVAALLAGHGRSVVLIEEKPAWEKPCGGGITAKALRQYPFLNDGAPRNYVDSCELISPSGTRFELELQPPIAIFSRKTLNGLMLDRAQSAGAEIVRDRVLSIKPSRPTSETTALAQSSPGGEIRQSSHLGEHQCQLSSKDSGNERWTLTTQSGSVIKASYVVLAAGARSQFRGRFSRPFAPHDLMITAGYYVPGSNSRMQICFLPGIEGYIWTFPRCDHFSAGICGKTNSMSAPELRRKLEAFLREEGLDYSGAEFYGHLLPTPSVDTLRSAPVCGPGWAMVGDAAGFVDPITGEGLYYAFRSADLLATALLNGHPESYHEAIREDFLPELVTAASLAPRFFLGTFLGFPVTERMVRFASGSRAFTRLLADLFSGAQGYVSLRTRGCRMLPRVLFGMGWSHLLHEEQDF